MNKLRFGIELRCSGTGRDGGGEILTDDLALELSAPASMGGRGVGGKSRGAAGQRRVVLCAGDRVRRSPAATRARRYHSREHRRTLARWAGGECLAMTTQTSVAAAGENTRRRPGNGHPTQVEQLGAFVACSRWEDIFEPAREQLKLRVLDSLGALDGEPVRIVREQVQDFGGAPLATLIAGERSAPDRAALYNGALVRYLDFNDSYLAPGETCHPSDNLAPVLAAAEYAHADGRTLLTVSRIMKNPHSRSRKFPTLG